MIKKNSLTPVSLKTKANWKNNCITSIKDLIDSDRDGFCKVTKEGKISWKSGLVKCLNDEQIKLPAWFGQDISYPGLSIILLNNAFTYRQNCIIADYKSVLRGEVWSSDYCLVEESLLHRDAHKLRSKGAVSKMRKEAKFKKGVHIYLGWIAPHYGHFLMEGLSRMWPFIITDIDTVNIKHVAHSRNDVRTIKKLGNSFVWDAYHRLGIELAEIYEIDEPIIFEKLLVPTPSFRLGRNFYSTPVQNKVWTAIRGESSLKADKKVYLSRRKYLSTGIPKRPISNELEIEHFFLRNDFDIVYPETLAFEEQLKLYGHCSVIAGPSGSNMHNSAFMPDNSKVLIITPTSFCVKADYMINVHKNIETNYFFVNVKDVTYRSQHFWTVDIEQLETCLEKM